MASATASFLVNHHESIPILQRTDTDDDTGSYSAEGTRRRATPPRKNSNTSSPRSTTSWSSKGKDPRFCRFDSCIRGVRVKWALLSNRSRFLVTLLLFVFGLYILLGIADSLLWKYNDSATAPQIHQASSFDVVINTYRRPQMLTDAVRHYADTCGGRSGVHHVYIIWAEEGVAPPTNHSFFHKSSSTVRSGHPYRSPVTLVPVKNSLNSRFAPIAGIQDAVFMVDDDIRVNCRDLRTAFAAWKANPNSLVGYYPRLSATAKRSPHSHDAGEFTETTTTAAPDLVYHSWPMVFWRNRLNIILTKACFVHQRYFAMYTDDSTHPKPIKDFVDQYFNCEDIAMAMLVANVTRHEFRAPARPIYVPGRVSDLGLFGGISTGQGHMARRSDCLVELHRIYQQHGWEPPLEASYVLSESSWVKHFPGFWWQQRPSNFFEWFAVENLFK